jgi:hypothetical protein
MTTPLPSRGVRGYVGGAIAGGISAAMLEYAVAQPDTYGGALLHVCMLLLVMIPLFLAGLGAGTWSGIIASAVSIGMAFAADAQTALGYALLCAVPTAALTALTLRYPADTNGKTAMRTEGALLSAMVIYAGAVFVIVALSFSKAGGLLALTTRTINDEIAPLKDMASPEDFANLQAVVPAIAQTLPALLGLTWVLFALVSMVCAHGLLKQRNWQLRPGFDLQKVFTPDWLIYAVAATGLIAVFAPTPFKYIGTNLCMILCLPFFFDGLAVTHAWAATLKARVWFLTLYYLLLSLPWTMTPVFIMTLLAGIADQWIHFRRRFAAKTGWKKGGQI